MTHDSEYKHALARNPDPLLWLQYADWLMANGDERVAECIRLQIRFMALAKELGWPRDYGWAARLTGWSMNSREALHAMDSGWIVEDDDDDKSMGGYTKWKMDSNGILRECREWNPGEWTEYEEAAVYGNGPYPYVGYRVVGRIEDYP